MVQATITNEGAFERGIKTQINDNFTEVYAQIVLADVATEKVATILLTAAELGGSETNTSFTFPAAGAIFLSAWLNVTDAESATIDVGTQGTSNDPDGIINGASVATLGYIGDVLTPTLTGKFMTGSDPVSVTASGDLNSCTVTLFVRYLELPAL